MSSNPPGLQSALGELFGSNSPGQMALYALVQAMVSAAIEPFIRKMEQDSLAGFPIITLSPAQLADMVNRGLIDLSSAETEAQSGGINAQRFNSLVNAAGESPGVDVLARALRLSIIPYDSGDPGKPGFVQGIQQSRVRNLWTDTINQVARAYPTPELLVEAWLRGQTTETDARARYQALGGVPEYFDYQLNVAGRPPSPGEAAEMVHRGIIPPNGIGASVTSYDQAVRESDLKDKWGAAFFALSTYVPPPRTVVALVRAGAMDDTTALATLQESGVTPSDAASYVAEAHATKTAADRQLAKADILQMYGEQVLDAATASPLLQALGYTVEDATFLLEMQDFRRILAAINSAVNKFGSLYIAYKITVNEVITGLDGLGIASNQRDQLLHTWTLERQANVKTLTAAEIKKAEGLGLLTNADAIARLLNMGYGIDDATLYLKL